MGISPSKPASPHREFEMEQVVQMTFFSVDEQDRDGLGNSIIN